MWVARDRHVIIMCFVTHVTILLSPAVPNVVSWDWAAVKRTGCREKSFSKARRPPFLNLVAERDDPDELKLVGGRLDDERPPAVPLAAVLALDAA